MPTINKVIVDGEEIINLDNDTLSSASQLLSGVTAHSNTGEIITGELEPPTGDISITENGSYNIAAYETATVNVPGSGTTEQGSAYVKKADTTYTPTTADTFSDFTVYGLDNITTIEDSGSGVFTYKITFPVGEDE